MPLIYTKGSEKTTILNPRQGGGRQLDFEDWTETRIGMFLSAIADTGPNDEVVAETVNVSTVADYFTFGLKDISQTLPGQADSLFIGVRSEDNTSVAATPNAGIGGPNGDWIGTGWEGTTEVNSAGSEGNVRWAPVPASGATGYCQFFAIKIVLNDRGLSTQNFDVSLAMTNVAGSDYSPVNLRTHLNNFSTYAAGAAMNVAWNTGAAARDIPDCYFVRAPLFLNRVRLSCIRAIRYAP